MSCAQPSRRDLLATGFLAALLSAGLSTRAFAGPAGNALQALTDNLDRTTSALREGSLSDAQWRTALEEIFAEIALDDLLAGMDFERLAAETGYADRGVATSPVRLEASSGERLSFYPKMFAVGAGRAIVPHGHDNMISAHLALSGNFHLRQYDKLAVEHDALLIRPTVDTVIGPGDLSSIGDEIDNVHWFIAEENAHTLDVVVLGLEPGRNPAFDIYNLDINGAVDAGDGNLRAPRISVPDALRLYG